MEHLEREQWQRKLLEVERELARARAENHALIKQNEALRHELWLKLRDESYPLSMGLA